MWLIGRLAGDLGTDATLADAERWFFGAHASVLPSVRALVQDRAARTAEQHLARVPVDRDLYDLLPYVLEPHGPGTRLSVMRDASTAVARARKKRDGVFYTPADVAEHMVEGALADHEGRWEALRVLDPACGTGVFLRAQLETVMRRNPAVSTLGYATQALYGFDVSSHAISAAAFVLLGACLDDVRARRLSPWAAWHAIRLNLVAIDALTVTRHRSASPTTGRRADIQRRLLNRTTPPPAVAENETSAAGRGMASWIAGDSPRVDVQELLDVTGGAFDIIIGNPPYAAIGDRMDHALLMREFGSLAGSAVRTQDTYPLFLEMMWRFASGNCSAAMVVPLSIAFGQGSQLRACRRGMETAGGRWRFAFFDREPHALFGEDVKTRNSIVFWNSTGPSREGIAVKTTRLAKWTSRTRSEMFRTIRYTALSLASIAGGVPKLEGDEQAAAFAVLERRSARLGSMTRTIAPCTLEEVEDGAEHPDAVFLGATAYNFLNVFRALPPSGADSVRYSSNPVLCLDFPDQRQAAAAFAILSSRLAFWLWHVRGDGFHVTRTFVETLPFERSSFNAAAFHGLAAAGDALWHEIRSQPVTSINKGRRTLAFRPFGCAGLRDEIDAFLLGAAAIPFSLMDELRRFERRTVIVDQDDARRARLMTHFPSEGNA